jgi:WD40 repeat protein
VSHVIQERSHVILASHFCRHDDVTTTNGKVMLLSIVYQLCLHSVSFESKIRALLIRKRMTRKQLLSADYPTASLYHDFIDGPLQSIEVSAKDNQCIVIDGLDLGNEGSSTKNPILKVIRSYLSFLPPWLRLVVATRPHVPIFKALRSFNAQMSEPQEHETFEDLSNLFNESLSDIDFGREGSRRLFADTLATTAHGNYAYATILTEKAKLATLSSDRSIVGEYLNLDFDQVLEKDLAVATDVDPDAFWALVRMLMVAFRAFTALDIQALTGFSKERLDRLLGSSTTFFVRDGSTVRFVENIVKCWLLTRIHIQNSAAGLTEELSIKKRKQLNKITCSATLKATLQEDMMHCHEILADRILTTLLEKDGSEFSFASDSTKGYVLQYGIRHIILAQRESDARDVVLDPYWIMERATDTGGVLEDLNIFYENDEVLQLLKRAISLSASAIEKDPRQIIGQLVGRLKAATIEDHGNRAVKQEVQAFVGRLESGDYGFEWWCPVAPTWDKAEQTLVRQMKGHDGQIQSVQLHPNDTLCATACEDGQVRVFNVFTGICTAKFSGHSGVVWEVNWSSAGDRLVSASSDTTVRVTRYPCGEPELVLKGHTDAVFSVKFSPDSSLIASGSKDGTIRIWCAGTGECLRMLKCDNCFVYSVDWKPGVENQYLCSGGTDNTVRIWNIQSSALPRVCYGHKDWVRSVAWSSNGNDIFSGSNDLTVICWDAASGECEQVLMGHKGGIWDVGQSQDGRYVFSGSVDGSCKVWECSTWRCDQTLKGHTGAVLSLSVSTDGARLLTGGSDSALIEWDCEVERTVSDLDDHSKPVWSVDISPDEKYVLSASSDSTARLWSLSTGVAERVFAGHTGPVWKARFSRSGDKIATASSDNTAAIYRLSTAGRILELQHSDAVWDVAWSKDDRALYTASRDHIIRCWCAKTGRCQHILKGHTKDVKSLSVSSDGTRLASASTDGSIRIWNLETHVCQRILYGQDAGALSVDWCPDNVHVVAGDTIGCVRQYNADSGERVVGFLSGHTRRANAVSCSGDGLRVASASTDKEIRIWNIEKQTCERRIAAGIGLGVFCVKYISGNRVISGGADRSIRVWNTENGRCEAVMAGVTGLGIYDVVFSPDGAFVASGSRDRTGKSRTLFAK